MIRIVLIGAAGRMGRAIEQAAEGHAGFTIAARVDKPANFGRGDGVWSDEVAEVLEPGLVAIEFSSPAAAVRSAACCAERGVPLVSGSTGLSAAEEAAVAAAAAHVPLLRASNFSIGLALLRRSLAAALAGAPADWDIEIVERHHRMKKDSPSGTALTLADDVAAARGLSREALRFGREGSDGPRTRGEIGIHSLRGGTWVGDHQVLLAGEGEAVELRHVVQDRAAFAHGALAAARFVATAKPGRYGTEALLGGPGGPS